jgi:peptidase inhibitor family I36
MTRIRIALLVAVLIGMFAAVMPQTAQAAPTAAAPASAAVQHQPVAPAVADAAACCEGGYFYGWKGTYYTGGECAWFNSDTNFGNDCGGFRNAISSAYNNSNAGNVVRLYYHPDYTGAWACLGAGDFWYDFPAQNIRFTWGSGQDGYNAQADNESASFRFRATCS